MQPFAAIFTKNGAKLLVWFKKYAIKLFQYSSIVFVLHNMEPCDGLPASQYVIYDATVG